MDLINQQTIDAVLDLSAAVFLERHSGAGDLMQRGNLPINTSIEGGLSD